jgi:hypothetical protein
MSQQRHSSEIQVTIDDSQVRQAAERLAQSMDRVGEAGERAFNRASQAARRAQQPIATPPPLPTGAAPSAPSAPPKAPVAVPPPAPGARPRDEKGRFIPYKVQQRMLGMTALDTLGVGDSNRSLDSMAAEGRRAQEASRRQAEREAQAFTAQRQQERELRRQQIIGVGQAGLGGLVGGAQVVASGGAADVFRAGGAAAGSIAGAFGLNRIAGGLPVIGGLAGALIQRRGQRIGQIAGLERPQTELALGGAEGVRGARSRFARLGISSAEGVNTLRAFQRSIGARTDLLSGGSIGFTSDFLGEAALRGIDPTTIGAFVGGGAIGGGARGDTFQSAGLANRLLGGAGAMGLTGAGATRFLAAIAQNTQRIASEGLSIDEESAGRFIMGINEAARQGGQRQLMGVGAARTYQRFGGALSGVAGSFRGQFGGIGSGALTAAAARGGGGPLQVLKRLEQFRTDPASAIEALRSMGIEGDLLQLALSGMGLSTEEADVLSRAGEGELGVGMLGADRGIMRRGMGVSRTVQTAQERLIRRVEADPASIQAFVKLNTSLEELALTMTTSNSVLTTSMQSIEGHIAKLVNLIDSGSLRDSLRTMLRELI